MLRANDLQEGACYANLKTRKWVVQGILANCHRLFSETSNIVHLDRLSQINFRDQHSLQSFHSMVQTFDPPILDAFRICTCFENFFKAQLLLRGFVIHKIRKGSLPSTYRYLATDQTSRPITINEINIAEGLKRKKGNNYVFQSLLTLTIEFSTFFKQTNYKSEVKVPKRLFDAVESINNQRNTLHYLTSDFHFYDEKAIEDLVCIRHCFNGYVVKTLNRLSDRLNVPKHFTLGEL